MTSHSSTPESAKQRSLRIPLEYVRPSYFQRVKTIVALAGCTIAAAYAAWILVGPDVARMHLSPGFVASAHAPWEQKCEACHDNFAPLRADADAGAWKLLSSMFTQQSSVSVTAIDARCQACHMPPDHFASTSDSRIERCTACHVDHHGRTATIARPHEQHCTRCHARLTKPVQTFSKSENGLVGHPPFRSLQSDPGNIRFNHRLHMMKGVPAPDSENQGLKLATVADLLINVSPAIARQLHRPGGTPVTGQLDLDVPVELDCSSCHELDSRKTSLAAAEQQSFSDGAYMLPVRYEQHCQACHPLYYESSHTKQLKHGLSPREVRNTLAGEIWANWQTSPTSEGSKRNSFERRIPGRNSDRAAPEIEHQRLSEVVQQGEHYLVENKVCLKCHFHAPANEGETVQGLTAVLPANIPSVWLDNTYFNHRTHLAINSIDCRTCHAAAFTSSASGSAQQPDDEIVMIDGRDVCLNCHSTRTEGEKAIQARFDCVECHRYHVAGDAKITLP